MTPPVPGVDLGSALALKLAIEGIRRIPTSGLARIRDYVRGRVVLVVGPPRVGKTSFVTYLQYGLLQEEGSVELTYDPTKTPTFTVAIGSRGTLQLTLRFAEDLPGHIGAVEQANLVVKRRPHALVIVLDASVTYGGRSPDSTNNWLKAFLARLEQKWARKTGKNRIRSLLIFLNKRDKVSATVSKRVHGKIRGVVPRTCPLTCGRLDTVPVLDTVFVANSKGPTLADNAITTLAKALN